MRAREKTTVHSRPVMRVRRRPKRWAQMPTGMVPMMLPNAIKPPISPRERSFRLKPSRERLKRKKKMENPKLKKRAAIKKSQNCPRGALADNRRKYRKADWITGTRPDRRPEDQDRQLLAAGPGSEAHRHRRWRECRSLLIAAPEPCQEDGGIVGS